MRVFRYVRNRTGNIVVPRSRIRIVQIPSNVASFLIPNSTLNIVYENLTECYRVDF